MYLVSVRLCLLLGSNWQLTQPATTRCCLSILFSSVWLDPNYQGSLSLTSPYKITLDLPSKDESSIPDPLGLGRRYRAIIGALQGGRTVLGRCGFGWMGKPDLDGWIVMSSREGTVGIWRRRSHYITDAAERSAISPSSVTAEETAEDDDDGVGYSA